MTAPRAGNLSHRPLRERLGSNGRADGTGKAGLGRGGDRRAHQCAKTLDDMGVFAQTTGQIVRGARGLRGHGRHTRHDALDHTTGNVLARLAATDQTNDLAFGTAARRSSSVIVMP